MRSSWVTQVGPTANDKCPYKRHMKERLGEKRKPYEDRSRARSDAAKSQRMPAATGSWKRQGTILS